MRLRGNCAGIGHTLGVLGTLIALASPGLADTPTGTAKSTAPTAKSVPPKTAKRAPAAKSPTTLPRTPQMPPFAKLQYDSVLSVNDRCAVRHGHLNPNIRPVYINRQPVGFC